jgi:peptidoglycan hydrolase CwlO-like protein
MRHRSNFFYHFFVLTIYGVKSLIPVNLLHAADCADYACASIENDDERTACVDNKIACYEKKLAENKDQQNTLAGELTYIDNRIAYQETQIEKTRLEIVRANKEMDILAGRISQINQSKVALAAILSHLVTLSYKTQNISDLELFLATGNFAQSIGRRENEELVSLQTSKNLMRLELEQQDYNQKVQEREEAKTKLEEKTAQLKTQQANLERQKEEKAILLAQTKNDEKTYQKLIEEARKEADAFKRFAANAGGSSCLSAQPGTGNNGWFYSQRDPRWCRQLIGGSDMTIGEVGCYITAVTMVHKRYGSSISPSTFAANRNYFFSNTALMTTPPAPSGKTFHRYDYFNRETIDRELREDRPVIVHVRTNNGYGGHFVVLLSGQDGNYKMHDPWYGADLDFGSRYSTGMIDSVRVFN